MNSLIERNACGLRRRQGRSYGDGRIHGAGSIFARRTSEEREQSTSDVREETTFAAMVTSKREKEREREAVEDEKRRKILTCLPTRDRWNHRTASVIWSTIHPTISCVCQTCALVSSQPLPRGSNLCVRSLVAENRLRRMITIRVWLILGSIVVSLLLGWSVDHRSLPGFVGHGVRCVFPSRRSSYALDNAIDGRCLRDKKRDRHINKTI